jgi:hypothetical protein
MIEVFNDKGIGAVNQLKKPHKDKSLGFALYTALSSLPTIHFFANAI